MAISSKLPVATKPLSAPKPSVMETIKQTVSDEMKVVAGWVPSRKDVAQAFQTLGDTLNHRIKSGPMTKPTEHLPRFSVKKFWDADSTPPALASLSRKLGTRTPEIEAGIVLASLMHDVAYYYGGTEADKAAADQLFGAQIPAFVSRVNPNAVGGAKTAASVDVAAVAVGGGGPFFDKSYSWSYGFEKGRGYADLQGSERSKIHGVARQTFKEVVNQIADGKFELSGVLKEKLAAAPNDEYRQKIKENMVKLAKSLQKDFGTPNEKKIPGF